MSVGVAFAIGILLGYFAQRYIAHRPPEPIIHRNVTILKDGAVMADNPMTNGDIDHAIDALNSIRPKDAAP